MEPIFTSPCNTGSVPKFKKILETRTLFEQSIESLFTSETTFDFIINSEKQDQLCQIDNADDERLRLQKEKNKVIAEKLSPVAKFKEYMRRSRARGVQRRKFSLLMGLPSERKKITVHRQTRPRPAPPPEPEILPIQTPDYVNVYQAPIMDHFTYKETKPFGSFDGGIELD